MLAKNIKHVYNELIIKRYKTLFVDKNKNISKEIKFKLDNSLFILNKEFLNDESAFVNHIKIIHLFRYLNNHWVRSKRTDEEKKKIEEEIEYILDKGYSKHYEGKFNSIYDIFKSTADFKFLIYKIPFYTSVIIYNNELTFNTLDNLLKCDKPCETIVLGLDTVILDNSFSSLKNKIALKNIILHEYILLFKSYTFDSLPITKLVIPQLLCTEDNIVSGCNELNKLIIIHSLEEKPESNTFNNLVFQQRSTINKTLHSFAVSTHMIYLTALNYIANLCLSSNLISESNFETIQNNIYYVIDTRCTDEDTKNLLKSKFKKHFINEIVVEQQDGVINVNKKKSKSRRKFKGNKKQKKDESVVQIDIPFINKDSEILFDSSSSESSMELIDIKPPLLILNEEPKKDLNEEIEILKARLLIKDRELNEQKEITNQLNRQLNEKQNEINGLIIKINQINKICNSLKLFKDSLSEVLPPDQYKDIYNLISMKYKAKISGN